jgi:hypothetical protein
MKYNLAIATCLLLFACGPTAEEKKIATDLTTEVVEMANATRTSLQRIDETAVRVSAEIHYADSLRMRFRRDSTSLGNNVVRLKAETDRLLELKKSVGEQVLKYRLPDLNKTDLQEGIAMLKKDREELISLGTEIQNALNSVQSTIDECHAAVSAIIARRLAKMEGK